jgi:hypothetical protein
MVCLAEGQTLHMSTYKKTLKFQLHTEIEYFACELMGDSLDLDKGQDVSWGWGRGEVFIGKIC